MTNQNPSPERDSALAARQLPPLRFSGGPDLPEALQPYWRVLSPDSQVASTLAETLELAVDREHRSLQAPLYVALAALHCRYGRYDRVVRAANESIRLHPQQHSAHRILVDVFWQQGAYDDAYFYLSTMAMPPHVEPWDEVLSDKDRHLSLAALAWRLQHWDGVREHVNHSYPSGVDEMPLELREDLFRVAMYRGSADEAAEAAYSLLSEYDVQGLDLMLRTMDARGWSSHALDLYRTAFLAHPASSLIRRRLVGLCIREGHLEEARALAEGMPLDLAA